MFSIEDLKEILKQRLSKKRYVHSLNVADECEKLAKTWGYDEEKAYLAGLLHDICKDIHQDEQNKMVLKSDLNVTDIELVNAPLWHSIAGSWFAENILNINDEDIICAIRYHTVARANMSILEEIVYIADLISIDRKYKDVDKMRRLAYMNLKKAMLEAVSFSIKDIVNKALTIPAHTIEAYNQYTSFKNK